MPTIPTTTAPDLERDRRKFGRPAGAHRGQEAGQGAGKAAGGSPDEKRNPVKGTNPVDIKSILEIAQEQRRYIDPTFHYQPPMYFFLDTEHNVTALGILRKAESQTDTDMAVTEMGALTRVIPNIGELAIVLDTILQINQNDQLEFVAKDDPNNLYSLILFNFGPDPTEPTPKVILSPYIRNDDGTIQFTPPTHTLAPHSEEAITDFIHFHQELWTHNEPFPLTLTELLFILTEGGHLIETHLT